MLINVSNAVLIMKQIRSLRQQFLKLPCGSSSIISHSIYQKYELKIPAYRQEHDWQKLSLPIQRQDLVNWQIKCSEYYLKPLYDLLKKKLLNQGILHADETSYRVLESKTTKTYYWTFLSGKQEKNPITLYHHDPHRSGKVALDFLGNFAGYLHCDMWQAYQQLPEAILVGCWAHVRRKFKEAAPPTAKGQSLSKQGVHYCNKMFTLENLWENLSNEERKQRRQKELKPLFDEFFDWCRNNQPTILQDPNSAKRLPMHSIMKMFLKTYCSMEHLFYPIILQREQSKH